MSVHLFLFWSQNTLHWYQLVLSVLQAVGELPDKTDRCGPGVPAQQLPAVQHCRARIQDQEAEASIFLLLQTHNRTAMTWKSHRWNRKWCQKYCFYMWNRKWCHNHFLQVGQEVMSESLFTGKTGSGVCITLFSGWQDSDLMLEYYIQMSQCCLRWQHLNSLEWVLWSWQEAVCLFNLSPSVLVNGYWPEPSIKINDWYVFLFAVKLNN